MILINLKRYTCFKTFFIYFLPSSVAIFSNQGIVKHRHSLQLRADSLHTRTYAHTRGITTLSLSFHLRQDLKWKQYHFISSFWIYSEVTIRSSSKCACQTKIATCKASSWLISSKQKSYLLISLNYWQQISVMLDWNWEE